MQTRRKHATAAALAVALFGAGLHAQASANFDVASVRPSKPGETQVTVNWTGGVTMINVPLRAIVQFAYGINTPSRIAGHPDWTNVERFDIQAKAPEGAIGVEQMRPMLQTLLAERFQFAAHYETVERPVFALVVARTDGRTRPGLVRSSIDCAALAAARRENREPDVPAPANGARPCAWSASYGPDGVTVRFGGLPLSRLAESVGTPDGRVILDRTGLTGGYEFTLTFTQQPAPGDGNASLFTALEEQLGLKLVPDRAPLRVLAVDRIERPAEN